MSYNKLTVMDFDSYNENGSRLVSFDDIQGTGWNKFGTLGSEFRFFQAQAQ